MSSLRMRPGVDTIAEIEARLWSPALRKAASPGEKEEGAPGAIFLGKKTSVQSFTQLRLISTGKKL